MRYTIKYGYFPSYGAGATHWAETKINEQSLYGCSSDWESAKLKLIEKLKDITNKPPIPEPEEIEI